MNVKLEFANKLKDLRHEMRITQDDAAFSLGIKRSRLAAYEEGRAQPDIHMLILLMDFYHIQDVREMAGHPVENDAKNISRPPSITHKYNRLPVKIKKIIDFILEQNEK